MASPARVRRGLPLRLTSVAAFLLAVLVTLGVVFTTRAVVKDQEKRLLKERADEVKLLLTNAVSSIPAALSAQGGILQATNNSVPAYEKAARAELATAQGNQMSFAWLRPAGAQRFVVVAAVGPALHPGQVISDQRVETFQLALQNTKMAATGVVGPERRLGFAQGPPAAPAGTVLYRESQLGPVAPPRMAGNAAYADLDVAIYGSPLVDSMQVLTATTPKLPLTGQVRSAQFEVGSSTWLVTVRAKNPLVGTFASFAPWLVLGVGLLASVLIAAVIEAVARRRDAALALYATEHRLAETLQRSLLPQLPRLPGLELAARYLAAGNGQQVGGDWFDVFPVSGDRVGLVVGDVMGHDIAAASTMAQIRSALRAYAMEGEDPAVVLDRLDRLVEASGVPQLVTVLYGVLDAPEADGSRVLRYSNAGHLPPLLRGPSGNVQTLDSDDSIVLGAPLRVEHSAREVRAELGSTLLLFTDGLVEAPGGSLDDAIRRIADILADGTAGTDVEDTCERVLSGINRSSLRDDIALLSVRLTGPAALPAQPELAVQATPEHA